MRPSTPRKYTQNQLTKLFFDLGLSKEYNIRELKAKIWENPQNPNSLRLTTTGWMLANQIDMKNYRFEIESMLTPKRLLQLERVLAGPYFIKGKWPVPKPNIAASRAFQAEKPLNLYVFDEQDSIMLGLYGDLEKFLDNQQDFQ